MSALLAALLAAAPAAPVPVPALGPNLERFAYPYPVERFGARAQGEAVEMVYMDVPAEGTPNGHVALLLHGKNFCGATWEGTARALAKAGYRVIIPDQIGFCKSSKPTGFQYSFAQLAELTRRLLDDRHVERAVVVGHSMGGTVAVRLALLYPGWVERLVLVNPLGLTDRVAQGVPYADLDALMLEEATTDAESIRRYQLANYYHGTWRPEYDRWVTMLAGMYAGRGRDTVIAAQARTSEMIATQPVAYELGRLRVPVTFPDRHEGPDRVRQGARARGTARFDPADSGGGGCGGGEGAARARRPAGRTGPCAAGGGSCALRGDVAGDARGAGPVRRAWTR